MCEKDVIVIDKKEMKDFIINLIESAYIMGRNSNTTAKEYLKSSIEHLPLVSKENRNG